ncbi:MAG TPA: PAS domain-containing protein [Terracidiphilus sp.]|nr:PAS domain-containing protein [Terracidiphilus sp.]
MSAGAVNAYLDSMWARYGVQVPDPAGAHSLSLIANASSEQKAILDALPVLIFLERQGKIVFANREARLTINEVDGEWAERPLEEVLWGLLPGTAEPQTCLKGTRRSRPFHATMPVAGGTMMPVEGTYSAVGELRAEAVIVAHACRHERAPKSNFMEDVLASLPEAVAIVHGNHILYTNPAFTRMFGCQAEEVEGSSMSDLTMNQANPFENAVLAALLEDHGNGSFQATLRGPALNMNVVVAPLVVDGEPAGRVLTFREVPRQDGTGSWQLTEGLDNHWGDSVVPFP